jgi:hypothetical protein
MVVVEPDYAGSLSSNGLLKQMFSAGMYRFFAGWI